MARLLTWMLSGVLTAAVTAVALCPADWLAPLLERMTSERLTLGDAQGTLWRGSGFVATARDADQPVTPFFPDRVSWRLSPLLLIGRVEARVENVGGASEPIAITGTWTRWRVTPASMAFPASSFAGLGAPFNTIDPSGRVRLSWGPLELARDGDTLLMNGTMTFDIDEVSSRLSPIKPLGAYRLTMTWQGRDARLALETKRGPMLLSGTGGSVNGRWSFVGRAEAAEAYRASLANLLNLFGERRREGDKDVIAIVLQ